MNNFEEFPNNPFLPGHPVSPEYFVGRNDDIKKIIRYLPRVINQGLPEHFFIIGKRGMGKTSFIKYVGNIAENEYDMFPIYINNEGTNTIEELIGKLLEKLLNEFNKTNWGMSFVNSFFNKFDQINIGKLGFKFRQHPEIVNNVKDDFIDFLVEICDNLEGYKGIFIIIDDINGLSQSSEFVNWYKSIFETLEFDEEFVPIAFNLVTYPGKFDQLCEQNPSFPRIFNLIEIEKLEDRDIKYFFKKTFNLSNISIDSENALNEMVYFSYGMPLIMQEIGESIFWSIEDNIISTDVVYESIQNVAFELRNKPLKNTLSKIKNPHYTNIFLKLAENEMIKFSKCDLIKFLNSSEKNILDDFLNDMIDLNILECLNDNNEEYEFVNIAFFVYFLINSTFKNLL